MTRQGSQLKDYSASISHYALTPMGSAHIGKGFSICWYQLSGTMMKLAKHSFPQAEA